MFERSDLVDTVPERTEFGAGRTGSAPGDTGLLAWARGIDRPLRRLSLTSVTLLGVLGFAALTGNFTLVLVAALTLPRRAAQGAAL